MRIIIEPDQWWDLKPYLTHGDQRAIDKVAQAAALDMMASVGNAGAAIQQMQGSKESENGTAAQAAMMPEAEDELLLRCTTGWSWPEPVSVESIGDKPSSVTKTVLEKAKTHYGLLDAVPETKPGK